MGVVGPTLQVPLVVGEDGELTDDSSITFKSPKAVDKENNSIKMAFDFGGKYFIRARKNDDDTFSLKINRALVPKKIAKYVVKIKLSDDLGAKSLVPTLLVIDVRYENKKAEKE